MMPIDESTSVTFTLSLGKVNTVLAALSSLPYQQVAGLITDIQQQATQQLQPLQPLPETLEQAT